MGIENKFSITELGVIPWDWDVKEVHDCAHKITDGEHITPVRTDRGYFLLSARNILNGVIDISDVDYVDAKEYQRIRKRCNPEQGDVVLSCSGTIGRVASIPQGFECVMVRSVALIKPDRSSVVGIYMQYYLQSSMGQNQIFASVNQGAQPNLFLNHIWKLKLALPSKTEQIAIAAVLSDTDALISSLEVLISKKINIRQGVMQELLKPKKSWVIKKLEDICDIKKGQLITDKTRVNGNIPVIAGGKTPAYYHNKPNRLGKTITISASGASAGYVSFHEYPIFASDCSTINEGEGYLIKFIFYFLLSFQNKIYKLQTGGAQPHIHPSDIGPIEIAIPSINTQNDIVTALSDIDAEINVLESKLSKYRQIKAGMMQNLLTGKIRLV